MPLLSITALFGLGDMTRTTRRSLYLVFGSSLLLMMGVNLVQPVLPAMIEPLGISEAQAGLVVAVYTAPAIVLAPLLGVVADLYGRRLLLGAGLILFGSAGTAIFFASNFSWVLILRAIQGIGMSAVTPLTIVLIGDLLAEHREVAGQGLKVFIDRIGYIVLPPLGGALAAVAWYWPFLTNVLGLPLGLLVLVFMEETRPSEPTRPWAYVRDIMRVARQRRLLIAFSAGFLRFFLDYGFLTYLPLFVVSVRGASTTEAGLLMVCYALGAMITASQAGRLARGYDKARLVLLAFVVSGLSVIAVPAVSSLPWIGSALVCYGLANGIISPMQKSLLTQNAPIELRGGVVSLDRLSQQISKTLAVTVIGLLLAITAIGNLFWLLGVLAFVGVGLMATFVQRSSADLAPNIP